MDEPFIPTVDIAAGGEMVNTVVISLGGLILIVKLAQ